ncbi:FliI/YscN family ATPase [Roseobacter denitrificans]|uniref:Flagellum-specific ATP synthase n=1 Tax=Roseobacter denitrificans (strain ATCC 33942 / OCh 114) TaxID=375451 RepID=Q16DG5_ROSDO|nr:FliI/YscN family ATPase [Roseobacter denitrificans]ABG29978.1 flagellum-specific ATP synthase [Roseobacter denitrificans OCh 114]SFG39282.1 flagellum-specific ATP synthase [Roseobacter denitrificans OCh 114]
MNQPIPFDGLTAQITELNPVRSIGRVCRVEAGVIHISGLAGKARIGDLVVVYRQGEPLSGEILQLDGDTLVILPDQDAEGVALNDRAALLEARGIAPSQGWIGRIIDPFGNPIDGKPLLRGAEARSLRSAPPEPALRRPMGTRLNTGMSVLNTMLPVVKGQRVGLFAGSGVGKSSLLGHLAQNMTADVVVVALIGERGRELRHFVEEVLGPEGLKRSVVICATSDQSPLIRRRCAWAAMSVAEHFRDMGLSALILADSITRFAEAHREVAVASGEAPVLRGYPPSTAHLIMSLCERAGPGEGAQGDITGIFSVLVAGSDMEEPIADILRGVLDGHIVLNREIAERGRYPAIDVLKSISRSLPAAADDIENELISIVRRYLSIYEQNEMMIRAGLYSQGSDPDIDAAIQVWSDLDAFFAKPEKQDVSNSFSQLELLLRRNKIQTRPTMVQ